jgi:hypothetical protein
MLMSSIFSDANISIASGGGGGLFKVFMKYFTQHFICSSSDVNTLPSLLLMGLSMTSGHFNRTMNHTCRPCALSRLNQVIKCNTGS